MPGRGGAALAAPDELAAAGAFAATGALAAADGFESSVNTSTNARLG
jgi:hypothetical protein